MQITTNAKEYEATHPLQVGNLECLLPNESPVGVDIYLGYTDIGEKIISKLGFYDSTPIGIEDPVRVSDKSVNHWLHESMWGAIDKVSTSIWKLSSESASITSVNYLKSVILEWEKKSIMETIASMGISINNPSSIYGYLHEHPDIISLVGEIAHSTYEEFATDSKIFFELYKDIEGYDEWLCIFVRRAQYNDDFIERIDKIRERFEDQLSQKGGWVQITTDFLLMEK